MPTDHSHHNILDNLSNCTISDNYLYELLPEITLSIGEDEEESNNDLKSWWDKSHKLNYKNGPEGVAIEKNHFFTIDPEPDNIWKPVFIEQSLTEQRVSVNGIYNKASLGTNEYIKFKPHFRKHFRASPSCEMVIPWKLNSDNFPYDCTKGVLCWVISDLNEVSSYGKSETNDLLWSEIPPYVPFYSVTDSNKGSGPYLKIDDSRILLPNPTGQQPPESETVAPNRGPLDSRYVSDKPEIIFGQSYLSGRYTINLDYKRNQNQWKLWIPEGDVFSYSEETGGANLENRSYISASLYQHYTAIYNAITIKRPRSFTRDLNHSRKYKNLAKYLASSPFITKFCINSMTSDQIQDIVASHINNEIGLEEALVDISKTLNDNDKENDIDFDLQQRQLNSLIKTPQQLFNKLKNKYGAKLAIYETGTIEFVDELPNKDDVAITNVYSIYTKNSNDFYQNDSYLSFCQNFKVNNFTIGSRINGNVLYDDDPKSDRSVQIYSKKRSGSFQLTNDIPLYDSIEPKWNNTTKLNILMRYVNNTPDLTPTPNEWSPDNIVYKFSEPPPIQIPGEPAPTPEEIEADRQIVIPFKILDGEPEIIKDLIYADTQNEAKKQFTFLWEQIAGPPIKFTDENISPTGTDTYDISTSANLNVVAKSFARYTIKCTITSPFGKFIKYKTFFIVRSNNKFTKESIDDLGNTTKKEVTYTTDENILRRAGPDRGDFDGPIPSETNQQKQPIIPNPYSYKFVKAGGINKIAVNARGLVWFMDTQLRVGKHMYLEMLIENLAGPSYKFDCFNFDRLKAPFLEPLSDPYDIYNDTAKSRNLAIEYVISSSNNSGVVYVDKIILENIRNGSQECAKCISTYSADLTGYTSRGETPADKSLTIRRNNLEVNLYDLTLNGAINSVISYLLPKYSLDYSPQIRKYGRYLDRDLNEKITGNRFVDLVIYDRNNQKIFGHKLPEINADYRPFNYPSITGYPLDALRTRPMPNTDETRQIFKYKTCYQKALETLDNGSEFYMEFRKGLFHPNHGWVKPGSSISASPTSPSQPQATSTVPSTTPTQDSQTQLPISSEFKNKSYVLKFNPGARDTFTFVGPSIPRMKDTLLDYGIVNDPQNINVTTTHITKPNIFSSAVTIAIAPGIRWDPACGCPPGDDASEEEEEQFSLQIPFNALRNQLYKEYMDQFSQPLRYHFNNKITFGSYYGSRVLAAGILKDYEGTKNNLDHVNDEFLFLNSSSSMKEQEFVYGFSVTGPTNNINNYEETIKAINEAIETNKIPRSIRQVSANLRTPRVNEFEIKDIEVRLNFLNYVNTQDLIVWLEVKPDDTELERILPPPPEDPPADAGEEPKPPKKRTAKSPITAPSQFLNQRDSLIRIHNKTMPDRLKNDVKWADEIPDSKSLLDKTYIANTGVGAYLKSLVDLNSNYPDQNFKIFLLNQEYIQNNKYNFSVKFTDHAKIGTELNDLISSQAEIDDTNNDIEITNGTETMSQFHSFGTEILKDEGLVTPTVAAMGYNEIDHGVYSNIIKHNYLFATNNTFSKLYGKKLFTKPIPPSKDCPTGDGFVPKQRETTFDSTTKFILKIAIVDEPDLMDNYDNIVNAGIATNYVPEQNKILSDNVFNSLCNWELILHTDQTPKHEPFTNEKTSYGNSDVLSLIKYHTNYDDTGYYGYNFIADLTDKQFLLPLANINAPYSYTYENSVCVFGHELFDGLISSSIIGGPPKFPSEAVVQILAGMAIAALSSGGTVLGFAGGLALGGAVSGMGYMQINKMFEDIKKWQNLPRRFGQIYNVSYERYPYGSPEKILLNISKDGCFWYVIEAPIFRLSNTPALSRHNFEPIFLKKITASDNSNSENTLSRLFGEFEYETVSDPKSLIDAVFLDHDISLTCEEFQDSIDKDTIKIGDEEIKLQHNGLFRINITDASEDNPCEFEGKNITSDIFIYTLIDNKLKWSNKFVDLLSNNNYVTINSVLTYQNWWNGTIFVKINSDIPFDIFSINENVEIFSDNSRSNFRLFSITHKAKILLDNQYYTIFVLGPPSSTPSSAQQTTPTPPSATPASNNQNQSPSPTGSGQNVSGKKTVSGDDFIKQNSIIRNAANNLAVIIKPIPATQDYNASNSSQYPPSQWKFQYDHSKELDIENLNRGICPQILFSTNSKGSYGDLSPKINKNYLHYVVNRNKIKKLYEQFNNNVNFKFKYDYIWYKVLPSMVATPSTATQQAGTPTAAQKPTPTPAKKASTERQNEYIRLNTNRHPVMGFSYSLDKILSQKDVFNDDIYTIIPMSTTKPRFLQRNNLASEKVSNKFDNSYKYKTVLKDELYEVVYLKNPDISKLYPLNKVTITIDGIGSMHDPATSDPVPMDRIQKLEEDISSSLLNNYAGKINLYVAFFKEYPSISTALAYLDSISDVEKTVDNVKKINTITSFVNLLFEERNLLLKLSKYPQHSESRTTNIKYKILNSKNDVNKFYVNKDINDNYYWIHIDPKQSCTIAEELRPKVLKQTKYTCSFLNPRITDENIIQLINNNICPRDAVFNTEDGKKIPGSFGTESLEFDKQSAFFGIGAVGRSREITYTYTVPDDVVSWKKSELENAHPSIAGWKEQVVLRTFYMNSTQDITPIADNPDYIIYVDEIYDVAVPKEHTMSALDAISQGLIKNDGSADTNLLPPEESKRCSDDAAGSLPDPEDLGTGAFGLLSDIFGKSRARGPTRVMNIFNLDNTDTIRVKPRKIPRNLRGIDMLGTVFRFGSGATYRQASLGSPLDPLEMTLGQGNVLNNMYIWKCLEIDENKKMVNTSLPTLMQLMNEMVFRAFYGSVDGIENRNQIMVGSDYSHQLIPFEYFTKPSE